MTENAPLKKNPASHRTVEVRNHSLRNEGKGLTEQGWKLVKQARKTLSPPYLVVISSPKRRCRETAEGLGFKDPLIDKRLGPIQKKLFKDWKKEIKSNEKEKRCSWFEAAHQVEGARKVLKEQGIVFLKALKSVARNLPEGGRALVVSHGERIETAALLSSPHYDLKEIGGPLGPCEGAAFQFDQISDKPLAVSLVRMERANG